MQDKEIRLNMTEYPKGTGFCGRLPEDFSELVKTVLGGIRAAATLHGKIKTGGVDGCEMWEYCQVGIKGEKYGIKGIITG